MKTKNYKYCIWDVGKVIYDYNLNSLNELMTSLHAQKGVFKFDYKNYMKGLVSFDDLCTQLCDYCHVDYYPELKEQISQAFYAGMGERYQSTNRMMHFMKDHGIKNGILSNALPVLKNSIGLEDLIEKQAIFASYNLGLLKPDPQIFQAIIQKLQVLPSEIIFVDDKKENVQSAIDCGIQAIVFQETTIENEIMKLFK